MKCPQCGNEVVIATDLCPWCGYKYAFDGSIERQEPAVYDGDEDSPRRRHKAGTPRERAVGGAVRTELGMRWYRFVVSFILPLTGVAYIGSALSDLGALYTDIVYYGGIVVFAPFLLVIRLATAVICMVFGMLAFAAARSLQRRAKSGISVYMSVILVPAAFPVLCDLIMLAYLGWYGEMPAHVAALAAAAVYAALTNVYFRKRVYMFE